MGKTLRYKENEFSFVWGKYDVPTDAVSEQSTSCIILVYR